MQRALLAIVLMSAVTISASGQGANRKEDPAKALWLEIKRQLTGVDAQNFFEARLKDVALPTLAGQLVSATPADRPTTLTFLMPDGKDPEVTLHMKDARGRYISFPGPDAWFYNLV